MLFRFVMVSVKIFVIQWNLFLSVRDQIFVVVVSLRKSRVEIGMYSLILSQLACFVQTDTTNNPACTDTSTVRLYDTRPSQSRASKQEKIC